MASANTHSAQLMSPHGPHFSAHNGIYWYVVTAYLEKTLLKKLMKMIKIILQL